MGGTYAGVLGPVAFCTVVARGLIAGSSVESTMWIATVCLFAFAATGFVVGRIAESVVRQSVLDKCNAELEAAQADSKAQSGA